MRVELIGCTSAGKSTLIAHLCNSAGDQPFQVVASYDYVLQQCGLGWAWPHKVRMALLNGIALLACLLDLRSHRRALYFAYQTVMQLPAAVSFGGKLNLIRLVMRNLGIDTVLRWSDRSRNAQLLILADEGTLQAVHYLFVHLATPPDLDGVARWATLVPLPDLVIDVQQAPATLIERTLRRGHGRIAEPTVARVTCFIERALAVFGQLVEQAPVQERLFRFDAAPAQQLLSAYEVHRMALHTSQSPTHASAGSPQRGATIAFIGPEATGKSTLVAATARGLAADWLQGAAKAKVRSVHVGKPSGGWFIWPLQRLIPLLRRLVPHLRTTQLERAQPAVNANPSAVAAATEAAWRDAKQPAGVAAFVYALRALIVAWERYRLLGRVQQWVAAGELVVCDRYPSVTVGAMDSPRLQRLDQPLRGLPKGFGAMGRYLYNCLVGGEHALYRRMPPPDVVIRLTVSLEVALQRNRKRVDADKDDAYMAARRHKAERALVVGRVATHTIHTDAPLAETTAAVRAAVVESLMQIEMAESEGVPVQTAQTVHTGYRLERSKP